MTVTRCSRTAQTRRDRCGVASLCLGPKVMFRPPSPLPLVARSMSDACVRDVGRPRMSTFVDTVLTGTGMADAVTTGRASSTRVRPCGGVRSAGAQQGGRRPRRQCSYHPSRVDPQDRVPAGLGVLLEPADVPRGVSQAAAVEPAVNAVVSESHQSDFGSGQDRDVLQVLRHHIRIGWSGVGPLAPCRDKRRAIHCLFAQVKALHA